MTLWWSPHVLELPSCSPFVMPREGKTPSFLAESGKCWKPVQPALTVRLLYGSPAHDTAGDGMLAIRSYVSLSWLWPHLPSRDSSHGAKGPGRSVRVRFAQRSGPRSSAAAARSLLQAPLPVQSQLPLSVSRQALQPSLYTARILLGSNSLCLLQSGSRGTRAGSWPSLTINA